MSPVAMPLLIGLVALLYASVGHAGATGYVAVMTLLGLPQAVIRPTALVLNVLVAAIATVQFRRAGHFRRDLFLPLAVTSVPCAALGGAVTLPTEAFEVLLGVVLLVAAVRTVGECCRGDAARPEPAGQTPARVLLALIGAAVGMLSGLTGVGGGVFLTPLLLALRAAPLKQLAAVTAPFILVNSLAGLAGGLAAGGELPAVRPGLVAAAILGGTIGAQLGAFQLPVRGLRLVIAVVLAVASGRLLGL